MIVDLPKISIQPGELYLAEGPTLLCTILGSCVGVTFWSARLGLGALCHGVLPRCPNGVNGSDGYRYVDFSIRYLARKFERLGVRRRDVEVKLFGGADVLPAASKAGKPTIGALNCRAALEVLEQEGFTVMASDLGGIRGRTIHFDTATGEVLVHRLAKLKVIEAGPDRASSRVKIYEGEE